MLLAGVCLHANSIIDMLTPSLIISAANTTFSSWIWHPFVIDLTSPIVNRWRGGEIENHKLKQLMSCHAQTQYIPGIFIRRVCWPAGTPAPGGHWEKRMERLPMDGWVRGGRLIARALCAFGR